MALFGVPTTNTAVQDIEWIKTDLLVSSTALHLFNSLGNYATCVDVRNTQLQLKVQITDEEGDSFADDVRASLISIDKPC